MTMATPYPDRSGKQPKNPVQSLGLQIEAAFPIRINVALASVEAANRSKKKHTGCGK